MGLVRRVSKIKNLDGRGRSSWAERTDKQREANVASGIITSIANNPMKRPEVARRVSMKLKGRIITPRNLFKKGNKITQGRKNNANQKMASKLNGLRNIGRRASDKQRMVTKINNLINNPMKRPEVVAKYKETIKKNRMARANEKRRQASLTNPNVQKNWFKKGEQRNTINKKEVQE